MPCTVNVNITFLILYSLHSFKTMPRGRAWEEGLMDMYRMAVIMQASYGLLLNQQKLLHLLFQL